LPNVEEFEVGKGISEGKLRAWISATPVAAASESAAAPWSVMEPPASRMEEGREEHAQDQIREMLLMLGGMGWSWLTVGMERLGSARSMSADLFDAENVDDIDGVGDGEAGLCGNLFFQ